MEKQRPGNSFISRVYKVPHYQLRWGRISSYEEGNNISISSSLILRLLGRISSGGRGTEIFGKKIKFLKSGDGEEY